MPGSTVYEDSFFHTCSAQSESETVEPQPLFFDFSEISLPLMAQHTENIQFHPISTTFTELQVEVPKRPQEETMDEYTPVLDASDVFSTIYLDQNSEHLSLSEIEAQIQEIEPDVIRMIAAGMPCSHERTVLSHLYAAAACIDKEREVFHLAKALPLAPTLKVCDMLAEKLLTSQYSESPDQDAFSILALGVRTACRAVLHGQGDYTVLAKQVDGLAVQAFRLASRAHERARCVDINRARRLMIQLANSFQISLIPRAVTAMADLELRSGTRAAGVALVLFFANRGGWTGPLLNDAIGIIQAAGSSTNRALSLASFVPALAPHHGPATRTRLTCVGQLASRPADAPLIIADRVLALAAAASDTWRANSVAVASLVRIGQLRLAQAITVAALASDTDSSWKCLRQSALNAAQLGDFETAIALMGRAVRLTPQRSRGSVWQDLAMLHDASGDVETALRLCLAGARIFSDWRLKLAASEILRRDGDWEAARTLIYQTLNDLRPEDGQPGRLWAQCVSLTAPLGSSALLSVLQMAQRVCPKSGEVWAEIARFYLNPHNEMFSLSRALTSVRHALRFTPQYGDLYVELLRALLLIHGSRDGNSVSKSIEFVQRLAALAHPNYGRLWRMATIVAGCGATNDDIVQTVAFSFVARLGEPDLALLYRRYADPQARSEIPHESSDPVVTTTIMAPTGRRTVTLVDEATGFLFANLGPGTSLRDIIGEKNYRNVIIAELSVQ